MRNYFRQFPQYHNLISAITTLSKCDSTSAAELHHTFSEDLLRWYHSIDSVNPDFLSIMQSLIAEVTEEIECSSKSSLFLVKDLSTLKDYNEIAVQKKQVLQKLFKKLNNAHSKTTAADLLVVKLQSTSATMSEIKAAQSKFETFKEMEAKLKVVYDEASQEYEEYFKQYQQKFVYALGAYLESATEAQKKLDFPYEKAGSKIIEIASPAHLHFQQSDEVLLKQISKLQKQIKKNEELVNKEITFKSHDDFVLIDQLPDAPLPTWDVDDDNNDDEEDTGSDEDSSPKPFPTNDTQTFIPDFKSFGFMMEPGPATLFDTNLASFHSGNQFIM